MSKHALKISVCSILLAAAAAVPGTAQQSASIARVSATAPAAPERCAGVLVDVTAARSEERNLACSAASQALELLGRCKMSLRRPLRVQIGSDLRHPLGWEVFGFFDPRQERVHIARYEDMPSLAKGTPFAAVQRRELFKSIIVHEVIHGVLQQNAGPHAMGYVAQEYVAYALQLESLPASERYSYFRSIEKRVKTVKADDLLFNDMLLLADPFLFAAYAYEHFRTSGKGCVHLTALTTGRVPFILAPLY